MLLLITISTFICISLGMMGVYWLMYRPQSAATERLKQLGARNTTAVASPGLIGDEGRGAELAQRLASPLSRLLPPSVAEAKKLQRQLMQAGFRSPGAPLVYRAIQISTMAGLPAAVAIACAILARPLSGALLWILMGFVVGFALPRYALRKYRS